MMEIHKSQRAKVEGQSQRHYLIYTNIEEDRRIFFIELFPEYG